MNIEAFRPVLSTYKDRGETLRIIRLSVDAAAVVHPRSGGWVLLDDAATIESLLKDASPCSPRNHSALAADHPLYEGLDAACREGSEDATGASPLDTIILKITNRCNESCLHCYDALGHDDADATEERLKAAIDQALDISGPHLNLLFHGGEPLLLADLVDAVATHASAAAEARGKSVAFFIQTNASVFNARIIAMLEKHDFGIGISLDGDEEMHDRLRVMADGSGTYRLFRRSYDRHRELILRRSGVLTTVTAENAPLLPEIIEQFQKMGFRTWNSTLFDLNGRGALFPQLEVDAEVYCNAIDRILDGVVDGRYDRIAIKPILSRLDNLFAPVRPDMCIPGASSCGAGSRLLSVSSDGEIAGCDILHDRAFVLGHMRTGLAAAAASPTAERLGARHEQLVKCHGCTWLGVCGGTCLARSTEKRLNPTDCRISMRINESLLRRLASDKRLAEWYERFPPHRRSAKNIHAWEAANVVL